MAKINETGDWLDAAGQAVPKKYVKPIDRKKDAMACRLLKLAQDVSARLAAFKATANAEIDAYLDAAAADVAAGFTPNKEGNYTLTGFSGDVQVERKRVKFLDFDEKLQFAKQKIDNCIERWSDGANGNLRVIVFDAFNVDSRGRVDRDRLFGLRRLNINDAEWREAMEIIADAAVVTARREYLIFRVRNGTGHWETIPLDMARV